jgi:hypothetical protein
VDQLRFLAAKQALHFVILLTDRCTFCLHRNPAENYWLPKVAKIYFSLAKNDLVGMVDIVDMVDMVDMVDNMAMVDNGNILDSILYSIVNMQKTSVYL